MTSTLQPRPVGRPSDYDAAYCDLVIALGKEGKGRAEIASALDCSRTTLAAWERAHPEFLDATTRAHDEALAWWEAKSRTGIDQGPSFNAALWAKAMAGRFPREPYRDRVQLTGKDDGPIRTVDLTHLTDEELEQLEAIRSKLALPGGDTARESQTEG